jgi:hypothetical protein
VCVERLAQPRLDLIGSTAGGQLDQRVHSIGVDTDDRPPICPRCGVTMVPAALSAGPHRDGDWVCLECEELDEED